MGKGIDPEMVALRYEGRLFGAFLSMGEWVVMGTKILEEAILYRPGEVEEIRTLLKKKGIDAKPITYGQLLLEERKRREQNIYIQKRKSKKYEHAKQPG